MKEKIVTIITKYKNDKCTTIIGCDSIAMVKKIGNKSIEIFLKGGGSMKIEGGDFMENFDKLISDIFL